MVIGKVYKAYMTKRTQRLCYRVQAAGRSLVIRLMPFGFLLLGSTLSVIVGQLDIERQESEIKANAGAQLSGLRAELEAQIRSAFSETEGIAQLLSVDEAISPEHFRGIARQAIGSVPYIHHIAIAPNDVLRDVYPLKGNERILGIDYRQLPDQYPLLQRARETRSPILAGPVTLYQGGRGLIYRRPVFVGGQGENRRYWGNVSIVADVDRLLLAAGLGKDARFDLALRGRDGKGSEGEMIWGDPELFARKALVLSVDVPGGHWQLAAIPRGGWPKLSLLSSALFLFALVSTVLSSLFVVQLSHGNRLIRTRNTALQSQKALLQGIVDNAPSLIYMFDVKGQLRLCNRIFERAIGLTSQQLLGLRRDQFLPLNRALELQAGDDQVVASGQVLRLEDRHQGADGDHIYLTTKCPLHSPDGELLGVLGISTDITEIRQTSEKLRRAGVELERLAHYDVVTGLPNRVLFNNRLQHAIEQACANGKQLAVLVLDIDGFKMVNDSLGHPMGDLLLQQATERFLRCVKEGDTVCRLGGDEFAFILNELEQEKGATVIVRQLLLALQKPFDLKGTAAMVTASIGIALCPEHGATPEQLLRHADTAMYGAKESGRNDYRYYRSEMTERVHQRLAQEHALRLALENNEFEVWYQPKIDLFSGRLQGAEALLRWRDPSRGLISPAEFIPLAERTGLIIPLGERVLELVCAQLRAWRDRELLDGRIAINVAALQIERSDFVEYLGEVLARHELSASLLEVEVTESVIMESPKHARSVLGAIQQMGVTTAIDDFGTGYSSLAYLKMLPIDHLKIDRAFIRDLPHDDNDVAITRAIIDMGHALGFKITAEGIETREQFEFLRNAGCDQGQGYLIGKPMPAAEFEAWVGDEARTPAGRRMPVV